jgi:O-glycosyl hydrolase
MLLVFGLLFMACPQDVDNDPPAALVNAATPVIETQPVEGSCLINETPTALSVVATVSDAGVLSYQWYSNTSLSNEDGTAIDGANAASYIPSALVDGNFYYYVVVTSTNNDATGTKTASVTSEAVRVVITDPGASATPEIQTQPQSGTFHLTDSITLTVAATVADSGTITYQWYSNTSETNTGGTEIPGVASASYSPNISVNGTYYYYVIVTNTVGEKFPRSITSTPAKVFVTDYAETPTISTQPAGGNFGLDASVTLSVAASVGTGTLSYQWYSNTSETNTGGTEIAGETSASYSPASDTLGSYYYYVVITNTEQDKIAKSVTSNAVTVAIVEVPRIQTQPVGGSFYQNDPVTLSVTATIETGTLAYQWYSNTSATNTDGTEITGATSASYSLTSDTDGSYYYYVVVTSTDSSVYVTSDVVTITIAGTNPFSGLTSNITLTIDSSTKNQFIRGVGGMSDQCFIYGNGSWTDRVTLNDIQNMFGHGPQELGLNMYRLLMYPYLEEGIAYTGPKGALTPGNPDQGIVDDTTLYGPGPDGGGKSGILDGNQSDYYNIIKKINEMDGYVMLCPWIIPLEFTTDASGSGTGAGTGSTTKVDPSKFDELADWYVDYIQNLVDHDAPIFALSVQNEPDQGVAYDGCIWTGNDQRDMLRILGPKLEAANLKGYGGGREWDKIWLATGENAGLPGVAGDAVINDTGGSGASQYVEIATRHMYGSMAPYTNGIDAIEDPAKGLKEIWQTEHCDTTGRPGANASLYNTMSGWNFVWHIANEVYDSFALNQESAFIWWTSKRFYGFIGEGDYTTTQGAVLPRGHVMAHFGKYVLNTKMINVTASGSFVSNQGIAAGSGDANLGDTATSVVSGTNLNPTTFSQGNSNNGGQNQPTTKVMAFEAEDGSYISVVAFTPTRNSGAGGQNAGYVRIDLPAGFTAASAELMRSNSSVKQQIEQVPMNSTRTSAIIQLPRSEIVSVKFIKAP